MESHWLDVSPIFHITSKLPPIFIIHGSADTFVPPDQSQRFRKRAAEHGKTVELIIRREKEYGWSTTLWDTHLFARWMAEKLP